jgi:hypothetical protein
VWGSRKAGVTIRQEDRDSAVGTAIVTAGVMGTLVGAVVGVFAGHWLRVAPDSFNAATGAGIGTFTGSWAVRRIEALSRTKAAKLVLHGNRIVIQDIGEQSARFLEMLDGGATREGRTAFFAGLRAGPTEQNGQYRLATAFRSYLAAYDAKDLEVKRTAMIAGNCEIVYHEHVRLDPYIRGAMPLMLRRRATQRLMSYAIGERVMTVGEDVPGAPTPTAARNWAKFEERMRYVFALFRGFHDSPEVFSNPYPEMEMTVLREAGHSAG